MTLQELKELYPDKLAWIQGEWSVGVGYTPPFYKTYGLLIGPELFEHQELSLKPIRPIYVGNGNHGNFDDDLALEERTYELLIKPYLFKNGHDTIFLHVGSESFCEDMQKNKDVDILGDIAGKNYSRSIKAIRKKWSCIFWECIKNNHTGELGWGLYTLAEKIWYCLPSLIEDNHAHAYRIIIFEPSVIINLLKKSPKTSEFEKI